MQRQLEVYLTQNPSEQATVQKFKALLAYDDPFGRSAPGHFTGSALVIHPNREQTALIFHTKLKMWFQPGGHADGMKDLHEVARKETGEETGLNDVIFPAIPALMVGGVPVPIDLDVHDIPANARDAAHQHYDARFLLLAHNPTLARNHESSDLRWVPLDRITEFTTEESVLRMVRKYLALRDSIPLL